MRITVDYGNLETNKYIEVSSANILKDYTIHILFSNGFEQIRDFKPFLSQSLHPSIKKYLDANLFNRFEIVDGNLSWNDYDMIFPISDLYEGKV